MKKEPFEGLKQSPREVSLIKRGQLRPGSVLGVNTTSNVVRVRGRLGLSQSRFAAIVGISADTQKTFRIAAAMKE
jgi:hypothetical protein